MANLQKLNPTQQELYNYLEQQTGQVNFEVLPRRKWVRCCTSAATR